LQEALAAPRFDLLRCGPANAWQTEQLATLHARYRALMAVHRLTREAAPGVLHDVDGQAFARLGVDREAQYLVRPDGHIGYRSRGTDLGGAESCLARWFPSIRAEPNRLHDVE
jgi:hypothetical protein